MGDGKEEKHRTPLPPPRAQSPLTNQQREERAHAGDTYDYIYSIGDPEPIHAERVETTVIQNQIWRVTITKKTPVDLVFDLEGLTNLEQVLDRHLRREIWPNVDEKQRLPVRYGDWAKGNLWLSRDSNDKLVESAPGLLLLRHPALPFIGSRFPRLLVSIDQSAISGRMVLTTTPNTNKFDELDAAGAREILGLEDLHELTTGAVTNGLVGGRLDFKVPDLAYKFLGVFPGKGEFSLADAFKGNADVEAKGVDKTTIDIGRDPRGSLSAKASFRGSLNARGETIKTELNGWFSRGKFAIDGTAKYEFSSTKPSVQGSVAVNLTDLATARDAVRRRLGKYAPADPAIDEAPNGLALWGEGQVDFSVNKWLTGRAEVVVDPDGFVTVIGELRPRTSIDVFPKYEPPLLDYFKAGGDFVALLDKIADLDGKLVPIGVSGHVKLTPSGGIGPGTIEDIEIDGVFSTYPRDRLPLQFSIAGTFVIPASLSLKLVAGVEITAARVVGAGIEATGTATLTARGTARPKFGLEVPSGGGEAQFFVAGRLTAQAQLDLKVNVACYAYVDTPFWKKKVAYPLVNKSFRLGSTALAVEGKYYVGGTSQPRRVAYDINAAAQRSEHDGFNNQAWTRKAVHQKFDPDRGEPFVRSSWLDPGYRAAKHVDDVTPTKDAGDSEISTQSLAAGSVEPYQSAAPEPPRAPPLVSSASGPTTSVGGGGSVPPPTPPTPPPPPPPPPPSNDPIRVDFKMLGEDRRLVLVRVAPPQIMMEPTPDRLLYKLHVTEIVLKRQLDRARAGWSTPRTEQELENEIDHLDSLQVTANQVEDTARNVEDPTEVAPHVAGLEDLADDLEEYGALFGRSDLMDESFLRGSVSNPPVTLPPPYQHSTSQVLRQLERAQPGRVALLIEDYKRYKRNFNKRPTAKKPTPAPMGELDYLEMRARFILGMEVEKPVLDLYNQITGFSVSKNNFTVEIIDPSTGTKDHGRKPDFFELGKVIGDVKNVSTLSFSDQLRDTFAIASALNVRVPAAIGGTRRILDKTNPNDITPRIDLIVRVPWHPRGETEIADDLEKAIERRANGSTIHELIDDPVAKSP